MFSLKSSVALSGLLSLAAAMPTVHFPEDTISNVTDLPLAALSFDCGALAFGLSPDDCQHMSNIGMAGQGYNPTSNNGGIWIGNDGEYTFTFTNDAGYAGVPDVPVTVVVWNFPAGDYEASFMNVRRAQVSYSLPTAGASVTVSAARDVSGGFAALYGHNTRLSQWGQLYNTWGEFTTGQWATVDVSRLVNMGGNAMEITVRNNGCVSDMNRCSFWCRGDSNECGDSGSYDLVGCDSGSQPGANYGSYDGINPDGGCGGWGDNGHIDVVLRN